MEAVARLTTLWDSPDVRARRQHAAAETMDRRVAPAGARSTVAEVMDFFEDVGSLMRRKRLDRDLIPAPRRGGGGGDKP